MQTFTISLMVEVGGGGDPQTPRRGFAPIESAVTPLIHQSFKPPTTRS